jgi:PAS domain S-box-containing protein
VRQEGITPQDAIDILETISDAFVVLDQDFTITYLNSRAERTLGRKREILLGKNHWQEYPALAGSPLEREYRRVMAERSTASFEHTTVQISRTAVPLPLKTRD